MLVWNVPIGKCDFFWKLNGTERLSKKLRFSTFRCETENAKRATKAGQQSKLKTFHIELIGVGKDCVLKMEFSTFCPLINTHHAGLYTMPNEMKQLFAPFFWGGPGASKRIFLFIFCKQANQLHFRLHANSSIIAFKIQKSPTASKQQQNTNE